MDRRTSGQAFMRELFRAWVARNPRRGTMFVRYYLSMLYPGAHTVAQLWHKPGRPYPDAATPTFSSGMFLTSRLRVTINAAAGLSVTELYRVRSILLAILPARMVLEITIALGDPIDIDVGIVTAGHAEQFFALSAAI
jgi:hypothetical protein